MCHTSFKKFKLKRQTTQIYNSRAIFLFNYVLKLSKSPKLSNSSDLNKNFRVIHIAIYYGFEYNVGFSLRVSKNKKVTN